MAKTKVFVIMPFTDEFFESYEMIKEHFSDNFEFSHAGDEDNQQNILADIIPPIYTADIVLADLTGLNPNVMYELPEAPLKIIWCPSSMYLQVAKRCI